LEINHLATLMFVNRPLNRHLQMGHTGFVLMMAAAQSAQEATWPQSRKMTEKTAILKNDSVQKAPAV
jgi:hypothetical protein